MALGAGVLLLETFATRHGPHPREHFPAHEPQVGKVPKLGQGLVAGEGGVGYGVEAVTPYLFLGDAAREHVPFLRRVELEKGNHAKRGRNRAGSLSLKRARAGIADIGGRERREAEFFHGVSQGALVVAEAVGAGVVAGDADLDFAVPGEGKHAAHDVRRSCGAHPEALFAAYTHDQFRVGNGKEEGILERAKSRVRREAHRLARAECPAPTAYPPGLHRGEAWQLGGFEDIAHGGRLS